MQRGTSTYGARPPLHCLPTGTPRLTNGSGSCGPGSPSASAASPILEAHNGAGQAGTGWAAGWWSEGRPGWWSGWWWSETGRRRAGRRTGWPEGWSGRWWAGRSEGWSGWGRTGWRQREPLTLADGIRSPAPPERERGASRVLDRQFGLPVPRGATDTLKASPRFRERYQ